MAKRKNGQIFAKDVIFALLAMFLIISALIFVFQKPMVCDLPTFAVSDLNGLTVYEHGQKSLHLHTSNYSQIEWSPDGRYIAFSVLSEDMRSSDVYILNVETTSLTKVNVISGRFNLDPKWSPDGRYIAFTRDYGSTTEQTAVPEIWIYDTHEPHINSYVGGSANFDSYDWDPVTGSLFYSVGELLYQYYPQTGVYLESATDPIGFFDLQFSASGRYLAWFSGTTLTIKNIEAQGAPLHWDSSSTPLLYLSPDEGLIFYDDSNGIVEQSRKEGVHFNHFVGFSPDWSPDGQIMSIQTELGTYQFYRYNDEELDYVPLCGMELEGAVLEFRP